MRFHTHIIILLTLFLAAPLALVGQALPERGLVRSGNRSFERGDYSESIEKYTKAMEYAPNSYEARYNLGNALFKDSLPEQAVQMLQPMSQDTLLSDTQRAELLYNLGNIAFEGQKLEEALELYKSSLRLNADDINAKYNYAYTKRLLEQQQEQEQDEEQNEDEQDQDQDQNEDQQDQDQNQDQEQNEDQQDQNQDQNEQQQDQQQQEQQSSMSQQQQEQILDAIQAQEDKTQDKLDREEAQGVLLRGVKNW